LHAQLSGRGSLHESREVGDVGNVASPRERPFHEHKAGVGARRADRVNSVGPSPSGTPAFDVIPRRVLSGIGLGI
jgi:hypothetical protein